MDRTENYFRQRPSLLSSSSGFTLLELLVASLISLAVVAMTVGLTLSARELYFYDQTRIELQQNLRSAVDLVGIDIREGGERFNSIFPAILITDGGGTDADELALRRNLLDEVLVVCSNIGAGSNSTNVVLSDAAVAIAACAYGSQAANITAWENYRTTNGGTVEAYIFNQTTKEGEWITHASVTDTGAQNQLNIAAHTFTYSYTAGNTSIYVMEERRFRLQDDLLQLIENDDTANPLNVAYGLTGFQVAARLQDGTTQDSFISTDDWTELEAVEVTLTGEVDVVGKAGTLAGNIITRTVTSRFFPRNILSN